MSPLFPIIAALMAGAALAFVLWPLLRKRARGGVVVLAISLAFALPVAALGLYVWVGTPTALNPKAYQAPDRPQVNLAAAVDQLQARLEKSPDDLEGWTLLAQAYDAMQQPGKAMDAWAKALKLAPDNPDILTASAQASSLAQPQRHIDAKARAQLDKALSINPDHQRALWLVGISDYQQGRYADAAATWQHLLSQIDAQANPKLSAAVRQQITRAQQATGMPGITSSISKARPTKSSDNASPAALRIQVTLVPELRGQVKPDSTVFIYARALDGPPMPLAIKRLQVTDLPAEVTLTDAMAMTPQATLSMFDQVRISARISANGQATPQTGDLEAIAQTVASKTDKQITLTIDHAIQ